MKKTGKKYISKEVALSKLQKYCAYQDRCHKEVRTKLLNLGIYGFDLEDIITELITDKFLDEERFARSYARGKFRLKKWGKNRIIRELKLRNISKYCIKKALEEIDPDDYRASLIQVLNKKNNLLREKNSFLRNQKLYKHGVLKGYEIPLIWEVLKEDIIEETL